MTFASIQARMQTPHALSPRETVESYLYLVSVFGQKTLEYIEAEGVAAQIEGDYLKQDMTSAKAKTLVRLSGAGQTVAKLKGELTVINAMIAALKRAQQYMSEEAKMHY